MTTPKQLVEIAATLVTRSGAVSEAECRMAVSAAYYGLFHAMTQAASALLNVGDARLQAGIERTFEHKAMRQLCDDLQKRPANRSELAARILPAVIDQRLVSLAKSFIQLQEARIVADYELRTVVPRSFAVERVERAVQAVRWLDELKSAPETKLVLGLFYTMGRRTSRG